MQNIGVYKTVWAAPMWKVPSGIVSTSVSAME